MILNQSFTPKYFIFHNTTTFDVYIDRAAKSRFECEQKVKEIYPDLFQLFEENFQISDEYVYAISLFEIQFAKVN